MLAIIVSLLLTRVYVGMKLKQAISDQVAEASNNRYKLSIEKVSIGILAFNATISGIQLYCDTTKPMADSVPLMVNLSTQKIRLRNLNLLDLLRNKKITLRRLEIVAPEVQVILNPAFKPKVDKNEKFRLVSLNIGDFEMSDAVLKVKSNMDSGMFYGIQKGAIEALKSDKTWFESMNAIYRKRRILTEQLAEKLGCKVYKEGVGLFVWAKLPDGITSAEKFIDEILYDKSIFITPGTIFGSNGNGYIRFSLCVSEEKIEEAISRI